MAPCRRPRTRFTPPVSLLQFNSPPFITRARAPFRPSVRHASVNLTASILGSRFATFFPWCMSSCLQWIRCDPGVLDRMLRGRIDLRGRILELPVPGIHDPAWVSGPRSCLTNQPVENSAGNCTLRSLRGLLFENYIKGNIGRWVVCWPWEKDISTVQWPDECGAWIIEPSFVWLVSFDSSLGWQVDRIYLAGLRIWRGWSSSRS